MAPMTVKELVAMAPGFAKSLRNVLSRRRQKINPPTMEAMLNHGGGYPFLENEGTIFLDEDAVSLTDLPEADWCYLATQDDVGVDPGGIICGDPVL
uniref:Uncharacterized protein n=1 Tax=Mycena chlorophos TaxID=658473 RepID=A0ABQ0M518_MYCCL|nr:predicted protein [Mycena chlorophos]